MTPLRSSRRKAGYRRSLHHLHRLLIRFWQNRLDAALEQGELAARLSRLFFPTDRRLAWLSGIFRALVLFELGKLDETGRLLERLGAGEFPRRAGSSRS